MADLSNEAREAMREYYRQYARKNRERLNEYAREYRAKNPDKIAQYRANYWEKKARTAEAKAAAESDGGKTNE